MSFTRRTALTLAFLASLTMSHSSLTQSASAQENEAGTDDSVGYFLGFSVGQSFAQQGFEAGDFTAEGMQKGLADALAGKVPGLTQDELTEVQGKIQAMLQKRQAAANAEVEKQAIMNQEKSDVWMTQNATAEGVKTLDKGIQYKVITEGDGSSPGAEDTVSVHYTGKLTNGEVFDSSVQRGEPAQFPVNRVIQGWQLALQKMKVGSKWMLYIPPAMAYGADGAPPKIGPNEVLVFEVELLEILEALALIGLPTWFEHLARTGRPVRQAAPAHRGLDPVAADPAAATHRSSTARQSAPLANAGVPKKTDCPQTQRDPVMAEKPYQHSLLRQAFPKSP